MFSSAAKGMKMCNECGMELPATPDYFDVDNDKDDGLKTICKGCRKLGSEVKRNTKISENIDMMDKASLALIRQLARGGSECPHVAELYQNIMQAFDGAGGFAIHFMNQYLAAQPGSTQRTKMLDLLMRLATKVTDSGAAQMPLDLMSDEDLQHTLEQRTLKLLGGTDREGLDGTDGQAEKAS